MRDGMFIVAVFSTLCNEVVVLDCFLCLHIHHPSVPYLCWRVLYSVLFVLVWQAGTVVEIGPPKELLENPESEYSQLLAWLRSQGSQASACEEEAEEAVAEVGTK